MTTPASAAPSALPGDAWPRYLADMRSFAADKVALETQGLLVRVNGLVLEAAGLRVPVGSVCEIRMEGQSPVIAGAAGAALLFLGAVQVLAGQLARAMFDQASASRDVAAFHRARAAYDAGGQTPED